MGPFSRDYSIYYNDAGVDIQPSVPNIPTLEGGGSGIGRPGGGGGNTNGGRDGNGGGGDNGGDDGSGGGGSGDSGGGQVMVCIELATGNLQRNVTVNAMTVSSPTSTGKQELFI